MGGVFVSDEETELAKQAQRYFEWLLKQAYWDLFCVRPGFIVPSWTNDD